jgi:hypothetical protein
MDEDVAQILEEHTQLQVCGFKHEHTDSMGTRIEVCWLPDDGSHAYASEDHEFIPLDLDVCTYCTEPETDFDVEWPCAPVRLAQRWQVLHP